MTRNALLFGWLRRHTAHVALGTVLAAGAITALPSSAMARDNQPRDDYRDRRDRSDDRHDDRNKRDWNRHDHDDDKDRHDYRGGLSSKGRVDIEFRAGGWYPAPAGPCYEERTRQVWVEPVYRTVSERVWVPPVVQTVCERVWIPDRYEWRECVTWECGRRERVLVCAGHYEDVRREVVVSPGRWECVERQELVCAGYWQTVTERVPVPTREQHALARIGIRIPF